MGSLSPPLEYRGDKTATCSSSDRPQQSRAYRFTPQLLIDPWLRTSLGASLLEQLADLLDEGVLDVDSALLIKEAYEYVCYRELPKLIPKGLRFQISANLRKFSNLCGSWKVELDDAAITQCCATKKRPFESASLTIFGNQTKRERKR